ncbi:MFS transporter [Caballeronia mineralivorans]|jgi:MHS family proline/betaine transporter-like MFS transporter|uniref:MFS transporter n=1 Tax=Caballeronia mineralivorans TaxID=2010198 RepID=UPI0023F23417|nr:MFS transporter [Caballeronia mineralivorans]MDB5783555.1 transporter [Caballeronia mineralivorans]MEA3099317.1 transporter, family, proline/betaine transporter [Caballeronia mineralivorans]
MANLDIPARTPAAGAASGTHTEARASKVALIAATTLGNGLEMFDFTIYSFFAVLIGKLFFPSHTAFGSLLMAVATFGIGFVMRPLGGLLIGNYADRVGRKAAMTLTIALMAAGTAVIGLAPTYAQIGIFAPLLIVLGRLLQGFSAGGEIGVSTTLLMESGVSATRGFLVSWQLASQGGAALAGASSGFLLSHFLAPVDLESWGWRAPFLCGLLIGPVGFYIRRTLHETRQAAPREGSAFREVMASYRRQLCIGILTIVGSTASMYIVVFYMPTYLIRVLHMPSSTAFLSGCVAGAVLLIGSPLAGLLSDRLPRRKPLVVGSTLLGAVLIYPAFWLLNHTTQLSVALFVIAALVGCLALGSSSAFLLLMEGFPKHVRATGFSVIYSIGVSVFGGFAQFIVTWLISVTGNPMSPAWYMVTCSAVSLGALAALHEQRAG